MDDIHELAFYGHCERVCELLRENPSLVNQRNADGDTPLHFACWGKQNGLIGSLMAFGPDVNAGGCYGRTPLHYAVHEGRAISVPIVGGLLSEGADPSLKDNNGYTPADWARVEMSEGLGEVLELLEGQRKVRLSGKEFEAELLRGLAQLKEMKER